MPEIDDLLRQYLSIRSDDLRNKVAEHYLFLVANKVEKYQKKNFGTMDLDNLHGDCCLRLLSIIEKFDLDRVAEKHKENLSGIFFSYVNLKLSQYIMDWFRSADTYSMGSRSLLKKIKKYRRVYYATHGKMPSTEDMLTHLDIPEKKYNKLLLKIHLTYTPKISKNTPGIFNFPEFDCTKDTPTLDTLKTYSIRVQNILADFYLHKLPISAICEKYQVTPKMLKKILEDFKLKVRLSINKSPCQ